MKNWKNVDTDSCYNIGMHIKYVMTSSLQHWNSYVLLTMHLGIFFLNYQLDTQFFFMYVYFYSLHVSGSRVPIIRRINCISMTSGIVRYSNHVKQRIVAIQHQLVSLVSHCYTKNCNLFKLLTWHTILFHICLFFFTTCFGQPCAHHQENDCLVCRFRWDRVSSKPKVTYTRYIDTINSPDDDHMAAQNMYEKELCVKLVI
jgi:hypothetical protein